MKTKYLRHVSSLKLDVSRCTGCGRCLEVCPHQVFDMQNGRAAIRDLDSCMECGACSRNCAFQALAVRPGVGCAYAVLRSRNRGVEEPACGCSESCCPSDPSD